MPGFKEICRRALPVVCRHLVRRVGRRDAIEPLTSDAFAARQPHLASRVAAQRSASPCIAVTDAEFSGRLWRRAETAQCTRLHRKLSCDDVRALSLRHDFARTVGDGNGPHDDFVSEPVRVNSARIFFVTFFRPANLVRSH